MVKRRMPQEPGSEAKKGPNTPKKGLNKGSEPKNLLSQPSIITALTGQGADSPTPKAAHLTDQIKKCNRDLNNAKGEKERSRLSKNLENLEYQLKFELTPKKPNSETKKGGKRNAPIEVEDLELDSSEDGEPKVVKKAGVSDGWDSPTMDLSFDEESSKTTKVAKSRSKGSNGKEKAGEIKVLSPLRKKVANVKINSTSPTKSGHSKNEEKSETENNGQDKVSNPYTTQVKDNAWNERKGKPSLKDILKNEHQSERKRENMIRVRLSFDCQQPDPTETAFADETKRILVSLDKTIKKVDSKAKIAEWEQESILVCDKMGSINPYSGKKYLDVPHYIKQFGSKKTFKLGLRINTDMLLEEFIRAWNSIRQDPGRCHMVPAEMQRSSKAIAIGFLQGSSNGQDTVTLNKTMSQLIGVEAEVSWQNINDMPIRKKLWEQANGKAEEVSGNHQGTYNNVKAKWSPSALQVFVNDTDNKKAAQKLLLAQYGKVVDGKWPEFPDGSRMKFVPFISSRSTRKSINKVETRLAWHVHSKATEASFDLNVVDIYEQKKYLKDKSLEQALRSVMSKRIPNVPVLKNIIRRWTPIPSEIKYKATVYALLDKEAESLIQSLKSDLHDLYGDNVLQHFPEDSLLSSYSYGLDRDMREAADSDIEKLLEDSGDEAEGILEPGFIELIQAQEYGLLDEVKGGENSTMRSSILDTSTKASDDRETNSVVGSLGSSKLSDQSKASAATDVSAITSISWRSDVVNSDKNSTEWVESRRVQKKLDDANITSTALNKWKDENKELVNVLLFSQKNNIYDATKQMILIMKGERDGKLSKKLTEPKEIQKRQTEPPEEAPPNS